MSRLRTAFIQKKFKDQGYWTTTNMNVHVLAYNTKLITRERLPRTYEELLNPVWRGKMVLDASEQWFALMVQIMGKDKGLKYIAALAKQNALLSRESSAMRAQIIAAGDALSDIDSTRVPLDHLIKRGVSIDWCTLRAVLVVTSGLGVAYRP